MSCSACASDNQMEFSSEMMVHVGGLKNLDNSGVAIFPKLFICVSCGFSQFTVSKAQLELLAPDSPKSEGLTMAAAD
jgi:hypothetical protein